MSHLPQGNPINIRTDHHIQPTDDYATFQDAQRQTYYPTVWAQGMQHRVVQQIPTQYETDDSHYGQHPSVQMQTAMYVDEIAQTEFTEEEFPEYSERFPPLDQLKSVQELRGQKEEIPPPFVFTASSIDSIRHSLPEIPPPFSFFSDPFNEQLRMATHTAYQPQRPVRGRGRSQVRREPYYMGSSITRGRGDMGSSSTRGGGRGQVMLFKHASKGPKI